MTQVKFLEMVRAARAARRPLLAFNVVDLASLLGVLDAAASVGQPVIIQYSARTVKFYGAQGLRSVTGSSASRVGVVALVHLDHCRDDQVLKECIEAGFDGIMADGSHLPYDQNVEWTSKWRKASRAAGVLLEAEFSAIRGEEDGVDGASSSGPAELDVTAYQRFCAATETDLCGCDIGTHHGHYARVPEIDFRALESATASALPGFVVHGGSGLSAPTLQAFARCGVAKINFSTDLKDGWLLGVKSGGSSEPLEVLSRSRREVEAVARRKWEAFSEVAR